MRGREGEEREERAERENVRRGSRSRVSGLGAWCSAGVLLFMVDPVRAQDAPAPLSLEDGALLVFHPIAVHFALALLLFGFVVDGVGSLRGRERTQDLGRVCFLAGVVALGLAVVSGWIEHELPRPPSVFDERMQSVLFRHEYLGYGLFALFLILAIVRLRIHGRLPALFVLLAVCGSIGLIVQGYLGGELVYRYGAGVRAVQVLSGQIDGKEQKKAPE